MISTIQDKESSLQMKILVRYQLFLLIYYLIATVKSIDLSFESIYLSMKTDLFSPKEIKKRQGHKEEEGDHPEKESDEKH